MEASANLYKVDLKIPFLSKREAEIAYDVLRVDSEPKRSFIKKDITIEENTLNVTFSGENVKHVRAATSSFFECLILCSETMERFGPPASEKYDFS